MLASCLVGFFFWWSTIAGVLSKYKIDTFQNKTQTTVAWIPWHKKKCHCLWLRGWLICKEYVWVTSLCRKMEIHIYHSTCRRSAEWQFSTSQASPKLSCLSQLDPWNWKGAQIGLEGLELQRAATEWWTWPLWILWIWPQTFYLGISFDRICKVQERGNWTCGPKEGFVA